MRKILHQNKANVAVILAFLLVTAISLYVTWPKPVQQEFEGVEYSQTEAGYCKDVIIRIDGTMKKEMTGGRTFIGKIVLKNSNYSLPKDKMVLNFGESNWTSLSFRDLSGQLFDYGELFADSQMQRVVIVEPYGGKPGNGKPGVVEGDNKILVFPAEDRTTAQKIAQEYFQKQMEDANHEKK